jgi:hypothetical protein
MNDRGLGSIRNPFTVYAGESRRFFGLTELETFTKFNIEPYANAKSETTLILDSRQSACGTLQPFFGWS